MYIDCVFFLSWNVGENEENDEGKQKKFFVFFSHTEGKIVERYDERRKGKVPKTHDSFFLLMVSATQEDKAGETGGKRQREKEKKQI